MSLLLHIFIHPKPDGSYWLTLNEHIFMTVVDLSRRTVVFFFFFKDWLQLVTVFSEKTNVLPPWIFSFSTAVTMKIRSRSPNSNRFFAMFQLYIHKLWQESNHWFTRQCHANASTNADGDDEIHTKINMSSSLIICFSMVYVHYVSGFKSRVCFQ